MRYFRAVLAFSVVGLLYSDAHACSCFPPPPVEEALDRADIVIYGQCYRFTFHPESHRTALIKVLRTFKGEDEESEFLEIDTQVDSGMCGYSFVAGQHYIIYATKIDGRYSTNICTRTTTAPPHYPAAQMALERHQEFSALVSLEARTIEKGAEPGDDGNAEKPPGDEREP